MVIVLRSLSFLANMSIIAAMAIKKKRNPIQVLWFVLRKIAKGEYKLVQFAENASVIDSDLIAPVFEEILYRYLFDRVWHGFSRLITRLKRHIRKSTHGSQGTKIESSDMADELSLPAQRLWFGYEPWVLVSSLLFAAAHLNNWWPTNEDYMRSKFSGYYGPEMLKSDPHLWMNFRNFMSIFWALQQAVGAGFFSLHVFTPLYQQRGLPASIAAHLASNLLGAKVKFREIQMHTRFFVRAVKYFRKWTRPASQ
jgi:hypothetical protein